MTEQEMIKDFLSDGLTPPYINEKIEQAILGRLLVNQNSYYDTRDILSEKHFYNGNHKTIYKAICYYYGSSNNNNPCDILVLSELLKKYNKLEEVGGAYYLNDLCSMGLKAYEARKIAMLIIEYYLRRESKQIAIKYHQIAENQINDPFEFINDALQEYEDLFNSVSLSKSVEPEDVTKRTFDYYTKAVNGKSDMLTSGFKVIDYHTGGFQPTDFIIIAARPGMGKTSFALKLALDWCLKQKKAVSFFSLEMSDIQLVNRTASIYSGIDGLKLRKATLNDNEYSNYMTYLNKLGRSHFYVTDFGINQIEMLRAKIKKQVYRNGVKAVIIDYLQLMDTKKSKENREREISTISRALKQLAIELNIVIIALAQLNRGCESRSDKKPMISDLRESGSLEQDADIVLLIMNPNRYEMLDFQHKGERVSCVSSGMERVEVNVAKCRNGSTGSVLVGFIPEQTKFTQLN